MNRAALILALLLPAAAAAQEGRTSSQVRPPAEDEAFGCMTEDDVLACEPAPSHVEAPTWEDRYWRDYERRTGETRESALALLEEAYGPDWSAEDPEALTARVKGAAAIIDQRMQPRQCGYTLRCGTGMTQRRTTTWAVFPATQGLGGLLALFLCGCTGLLRRAA
jgi:hypothetical protein